ncbi:MAG: LEPR-XLL domain-containing protein [Hydrogenophilales bacterium]|nr:LEPR-XLL domain-containing protein [Hydrogenophilales bacterium]
MAAPRNRPVVEELEARVLYSADLAPGFAAGVLPVDARVDDVDTLLAGLDTAFGRRFEVIVIYGCDVGAGEAGRSFVERLVRAV